MTKATFSVQFFVTEKQASVIKRILHMSLAEFDRDIRRVAGGFDKVEKVVFGVNVAGPFNPYTDPYSESEGGGVARPLVELTLPSVWYHDRNTLESYVKLLIKYLVTDNIFLLVGTDSVPPEIVVRPDDCYLHYTMRPGLVDGAWRNVGVR